MADSGRTGEWQSGSGKPLPDADDRHERRLLTALSYDLVGSTDLLRLLDIEDFESLVSSFQDMAREAIVSCTGTLRVEIGDGGVAVFPASIGTHDAASLGIRAGLEIVEGCRKLALRYGRGDLHVRVGVATSMSLILKGDNAAKDAMTGPAFAMAARLQALARPDTVLVSDETRILARRSHAFRFKGTHAIKGFAEPRQVWQALAHRRGDDRFFAFGRSTSPLIDRTEEFAAIRQAWAQASSGHGQIVVIEGEAGLGKSRLVHELRRRTRLERHRLLFFQCMPSDLHSTLHPLRQSLQRSPGGGAATLTTKRVSTVFSAHNVRDAEVVGLFSFLLGTDETDSELREMNSEAVQEKAAWASREALRAMCADGPVMLIVEDIHWIDGTSRQLLAEMVPLIPDCAVLLIATTRPGMGGWLSDMGKRIVLGPLDPADTKRAIEAMWPRGKPSADPEFAEVLERVTGGVPLFIEEICNWMAEAADPGRLPEGSSPDRASVFETVIDARLEPLGMAREVARAAAIAGGHFSMELLAALLPRFDPDRIAEALDVLAESGFVVRTRHTGVSLHSFRHTLIRETIYNGTLRKRRQLLHQRLYEAVSRNRNLAAWLTAAALASHAQEAGLLEEAIGAFVNAGVESSSRSALAEARQLLEHALALCGQVPDADRRDASMLTAMVALGPILTALEGPNSAHARTLYEDGVTIARRRPAGERAKWFPIYWGWWFTDSVIDGERVQAVFNDLEEVDDPEVQLQARHCLWAVDFNSGNHRNCIASVESGLPLYRMDHGHTNAVRFGGHDAKVCGLAHRGLSLWFSGKAASALRSIAEARQWALATGHAGSIAHGLINEAMLHTYRRDFTALRGVVADLGRLTERHHLPSLEVSARIFEGWCDGNAGDLAGGAEKVRQGLGLHGAVQTPEDEPVYCAMLAELLARSGEIDDALALLRSAVAQANAGGSRYWLPELHRRIALLLLHLRGPDAESMAALEKCLVTAVNQNAVPTLISTYELMMKSKAPGELLEKYRDRYGAALGLVEAGAPLVVNPEPWP